jgi:hypothetical protein
VAHRRRLQRDRDLEHAQITPTSLLKVVIYAANDAPTRFATEMVQFQLFQVGKRAL